MAGFQIRGWDLVPGFGPQWVTAWTSSGFVFASLPLFLFASPLPLPLPMPRSCAVSAF